MTWACTAWDVCGMGGVGVQVCCVGVIGVGAGVDRKDMGVGGSGGLGMGVGGVGGVDVKGLDGGGGGGSVGVVGVDVGVGGVGAGAGSSRRLSLSSWPSTCTPFIASCVSFGHVVGLSGLAKEDTHAELGLLFFRVTGFAEGKFAALVKTLHKGPTSKTPTYVLALSRALEALPYSLSAPKTDRKDPLSTYILALRGRDVATYLLMASAFVDGPAVPEEAVCRTDHARALRTDADASASLLGGAYGVESSVTNLCVCLPSPPWLKWD